MERPLRIALFGLTGYGETHLKEIQRREALGEAVLSAAVAINHSSIPETVRRLRETGTCIYETAEAFFEGCDEGVDLVVLPTSIDSHESLMCRALAMGTNVLLEKPVTGSVQSLNRMIKVERSSDGFCTVGFQHVYDQKVQSIKKELVSGKWGRVLDVGVVGIWPRADWYYDRNDWAGRLTRRGVEMRDSPVNNAFAHFVNLAMFWSARDYWSVDRAISVQGTCCRARAIASFDTAALRVETKSGTIIRIHLSHAGAWQRDVELKLRCEKGSFTWSPKWSGPGGGYFRQMYDSVLDGVRGYPADLFTLAMGGEHVRLVELLHKNVPIEDYSGELVIDPATGQRDIRGMLDHFDTAHGEGKLCEYLKKEYVSNRGETI